MRPLGRHDSEAPGRAWKRVGLALVLMGVVAAGISEATVALFGTTVTILSRRSSPEEEQEQRRIRDPRDDIAEIYGAPVGGPLRIVTFHPDDLIVPREESSRRLCHVPIGQPWPLQVATLRAWALSASAVLLILGGVLFLMGAVRRGRVGVEPPSPPG